MGENGNQDALATGGTSLAKVVNDRLTAPRRGTVHVITAESLDGPMSGRSRLTGNLGGCGHDRRWPMRSIVDAVFYILRNGVPWRSLPKDFPPWNTVYHWFRRFAREALFERMNHALVMRERERAGREASPTAAVIDSQTVKATEAPAPRLRRRQEDRRSETPRPGRLQRKPADARILEGGPSRFRRREWPFVAHV